jgi:hypothetical protein
VGYKFVPYPGLTLPAPSKLRYKRLTLASNPTELSYFMNTRFFANAQWFSGGDIFPLWKPIPLVSNQLRLLVLIVDYWQFLIRLPDWHQSTPNFQQQP